MQAASNKILTNKSSNCSITSSSKVFPAICNKSHWVTHIYKNKLSAIISRRFHNHAHLPLPAALSVEDFSRKHVKEKKSSKKHIRTLSGIHTRYSTHCTLSWAGFDRHTESPTKAALFTTVCEWNWEFCILRHVKVRGNVPRVIIQPSHHSSQLWDFCCCCTQRVKGSKRFSNAFPKKLFLHIH